MIEHALLYHLHDAPPLHGLLSAVGLGAAVPPPREGGEPVTRATIPVADMRVELVILPPQGMRDHLDGLHQFLTGRCEVAEPELPEKLKNARGVVAITLDPGYRPTGTAFLRALARATGALIFFEADGSIQDGNGNRLAEPLRVEAEPVEEEPGDEGPLEVRSASTRQEHVARRALILAALAWRSWLEATRPPDAEAQCKRFVEWVEQQDLVADMEGPELTLANDGLGSWSEEEVRTQAWGIEGAAVLAWALGLFDLPAHDAKVDPPAVGKALGLFEAQPAALAAQLRSDEEIEAMSRRLLGIHWRLREFQRAPGKYDFEAFSKGAWFGGFDLAGIPVSFGDLAIDGMPIEYAPQKAVQMATSIAAERYRAIAWVHGKVDERVVAS